MKDFFVDQVFGGSILVAAPIAVIAGLISFLSPCVLPLVPGYLAYVSGAVQTRVRMFFGALLFILGFSLLFMSYGALFGELGGRLLAHASLLSHLLGFLTIIFGLVFLAPELFFRSWKMKGVTSTGIISAPILGFAFGLGWTPCIGPTLGAVQTLAFTESSASRGAVLTLFYCLGLGGPFLLFALAFDRLGALKSFVTRHHRMISRSGGIFLIAIGLLQVFGVWETLMINLRSSITEFIPVL
ncbi:MAG: hypothetical protein RLZZ251_544 [Actinomycetota bacterium]|jgi:cytochrome c-type biogenesis protein